MKCWLMNLCGLFCLFSPAVGVGFEIPADVLTAEQQRVEVIAKVAPSVVAIFPPDGKGGGSGVLISPSGLTLTNYHVVQGAGPFLKCGLQGGQLYDAVLIGIDPTGDVAIIQLLGRTDFPYAPLGDSDTVKAGDWAFAMGNPFLLAEDFQPTLTYGMVSGVQRYQYPAGSFLEYTDCIQVDTSINPGNSGGPLFNDRGEVIGINGRISVEKRGRVNAGAGYAISINQIKHFRDHLLSGRVVDHATLGATVRSDEFSTVIVDTILPDCDAFFQGLRAGDEIISFGGRVIGSVNQFKNVLGIYPKGWKVPLIYRRDGQRTEIFVRLEALHSTGELLEFATAPVQPQEKEEPDSEKEGEEKKPEPEHEIPNPLQALMPPQQKIPEEHAHLFESRMGFANYYFNRQKQEQLWQQLQSYGTFKPTRWKWSFAGTIAGQTPFRMVITDTASLLQLPAEQRVFLLEMDRSETYMAGWKSDGLLMAFYQLQRLLTLKEEGFSEIYYVGSQPLDGNGPRVDMLSTMENGRECWWYFDQQTKQLVGWDAFILAGVPECGIRLAGWTKTESYSYPSGFLLRTAGQPDLEFQIENLEAVEFAAEVTP